MNNTNKSLILFFIFLHIQDPGYFQWRTHFITIMCSRLSLSARPDSYRQGLKKNDSSTTLCVGNTQEHSSVRKREKGEIFARDARFAKLAVVWTTLDAGRLIFCHEFSRALCEMGEKVKLLAVSGGGDAWGGCRDGRLSYGSPMHRFTSLVFDLPCKWRR